MPFKSKEPEVNFNREYQELKLEVHTTMMPNGFGGEKLRFHRGEVIKTIKTVRIEERRARQLNRTWHTRLLYYLPVGEKKPFYIKRTPVPEGAGEQEWDDHMEHVA